MKQITTTRRRELVTTALMLAGALSLGVAQAQTPTITDGQPAITFVTGSAPGGGVDNVTRFLAESMGAIMGRTIVVDNRPGASYTIAAAHVARAAPDGNTALVTFNVHPAAGALIPNLPFDPLNSFRAVGKVATTPYALVASPSLQGDTIKEVIDLAKKDGRSLSFASIGLGTPQHLMLERLKQQTGADIIMAHYSNPSQGQLDVMAGRVDFTLSTIAFCEPHVASGKMKVLAVTSDERLPVFPDAITVKEAGYEGFITDGWYALMLPAKTPDAIVKQYNDALEQALATPALQERFRAANLTPTPGEPEVLTQLIEHELGMWREIIAERGIKAE